MLQDYRQAIRKVIIEHVLKEEKVPRIVALAQVVEVGCLFCRFFLQFFLFWFCLA